MAAFLWRLLIAPRQSTLTSPISHFNCSLPREQRNFSVPREDLTKAKGRDVKDEAAHHVLHLSSIHSIDSAMKLPDQCGRLLMQRRRRRCPLSMVSADLTAHWNTTSFQNGKLMQIDFYLCQPYRCSEIGSAILISHFHIDVWTLHSQQVTTRTRGLASTKLWQHADLNFAFN